MQICRIPRSRASGVPVDRQDDDDAEDADAQRVRIVGARLGALGELGHAAEPQQPVEADVRGGRAEPGGVRVVNQRGRVPSQA